MKTFTKAVWIGSLVAGGLAVAAATPALASTDEHGECPRGGHSMMMNHRGDGEGRFLEHLTRRLDLTKEQQVSIEAILKKSEAQRRETRDKLLASREALRKATDAGQADEQVQKLAQEQGKLVAEQIVQRVRIRAEIDKVLTEAQRGQLKDLRERHEHRFRG